MHPILRFYLHILSSYRVLIVKLEVSRADKNRPVGNQNRSAASPFTVGYYVADYHQCSAPTKLFRLSSSLSLFTFTRFKMAALLSITLAAWVADNKFIIPSNVLVQAEANHS
jgi:hypothetical protein